MQSVPDMSGSTEGGLSADLCRQEVNLTPFCFVVTLLPRLYSIVDVTCNCVQQEAAYDRTNDNEEVVAPPFPPLYWRMQRAGHSVHSHDGVGLRRPVFPLRAHVIS